MTIVCVKYECHDDPDYIGKLDITGVRSDGSEKLVNGWRYTEGLEIDLYANGLRKVPDLSKI